MLAIGVGAAVLGGSGAAGTPDSPGRVRALVYELDGWIYRARVDGSRPVRLTKGTYPKISPDGRWIAFAVETRVRDRTQYGLHLVSSAGRNPRFLGLRAGLADFQWLPDSPTLLVHDSDGLWLMRHATPPRRLARQYVPDAGAIFGVSISPDGRFVAYDRRSTEGADLFGLSLPGGEERRLTRDRESIGAVVGPRAIAYDRFVDHPQPHREIWLTDRDGSNHRPLRRTNSLQPLFWFGDGRRILAVRVAGGLSPPSFGRLFVVDVETGASRPVYRRWIETLRAYALSRDGRFVLAGRGCGTYGTIGEPTPGQVEVAPVDGGRKRVLVKGPCFASWNA